MFIITTDYIQLQFHMQRVSGVIHMDSCMLWMTSRNSPTTYFYQIDFANTCIGKTLK